MSSWAKFVLGSFMVIVMVGSLFVALICYLAVEMKGDLLNSPNTARASVLDVARAPANNNNYMVRVRFQTANGETVTVRASDGKRTELEQSDTVVVYYNPAAPQEILLESNYKSLSLAKTIGTYASSLLVILLAALMVMAFRGKGVVR